MNNLYRLPDQRDPPHNLEAEMGLLGGILNNNRAYDLVSGFLKPEHFYDGAHATIFDGISISIEKGRRADATTLQRLLGAEDYEEIGGAEYLVQLSADTDTVIFAHNVTDYGKLIHDLYLRRVMIEACDDGREEAFGGKFETDAHEVAQNIMARISEVADMDPDGGPIPLAEAMAKAISQVERARTEGRPSFRETGLTSLDDLIGGLPDSELCIIGGRPGMGKTAAGISIARHVAKTEPVLYFSLEMDEMQLGLRVACIEAGVDADLARRGKLSTDDQNRLSAARTASEALLIDPTSQMTVQAISGRARRLHKRNPLGLVVVDHLGLMRPNDPKRFQPKVYEIEEYTQGLKALAKYLKCPVLVLHQLSRAVDQRDDKRPMLSDLRDSGSLEQDAAVVMFLYRHEYYIERDKPDLNETAKYADWSADMDRCRGLCEISVAKNRFGPGNTIANIGFDAKSASFQNIQKPAQGQLYSDREF